MGYMNQALVSGAGAAPRLVLFGDSRAWDNSQADMQSWTSAGFHPWAAAQATTWMPVVKNSGIVGDTAANMLTRIQADVLAYSPTDVVYICDHNDIHAGLTADQVWTSQYQIFEKCRQAGIFVHDVGPYPGVSGTGNFDTAAQWSEKLKLRKLRADYWLAHRGSGNLIDAWAAIATATSTALDPISGALRDYVHLAALGAQRVGALLAVSYSQRGVPKSILQPQGAWDEPRYAQTRNVMRNPYMLGGSGTTLPTGWGDGSKTTARATVARADGQGNEIQVSFAAIPAGAADAINFGLTAADIDTSANYVLVADISFAGCTNIASPNLMLSWNAGGTYYSAGLLRPGGAASNTNLQDFAGTFVSPVMTFPGMTGMYLYIGMYANSGGAGSGTMKVSRIALVKVPAIT